MQRDRATCTRCGRADRLRRGLPAGSPGSEPVFLLSPRLTASLPLLTIGYF